MTTIGFVRHGVTAWNKEGRAQGSSDIPLDADGIKMAEQVAERLSKEKWDVIYTSPLIRASKTAEMIADKMPGIEVVEDNRLREVGGGLIEGTTIADRIEKWGENWRELDLGFEPKDEKNARGLEFIAHIKNQYGGKKVLAVSHGAFIGQLIRILVPNQEFDTSLHNTSVTIIELDEKKNNCSLFNCITHLS